MTRSEFLSAYKRVFVDDNELRIGFKMGENLRGKKRIDQVVKRFEEISNAVFGGDEIWVLLIIWDANGENKKKLIDIGFDINLASNYAYGKIDDGVIVKEKFAEDAFEDAKILYIKYDQYSFNYILPLVYSKTGFELAFENTAQITAYFMSFSKHPVLLNLYDDRGMELLSHDKEVIDSVAKKFSKYIISNEIK